MNNRGITYRVEDTRFGFWSNVEILDDRIEIHPAKNYLWGKIAGVIFLTCAVWSFLPVAINAINTLIGSFILVFVFRSLVSMARRSQNSSPKPILLYAPKCCDIDENSYSQGRKISFEEIEQIIVRENSGRFTDDLPLVQIYLITTIHDTAIIIHQKLLGKKDETLELAEKIANKLDVKVVNQLNN